MKATVKQENLSKALATVGRVVSGRASLPVLSNVLLSTDGKRLRLSATNLEIGINFWIGGKVEHEGAVTIPARLLSDFVSSLPGGTITLDGAETSLEVSTPHYQSSFNGIAAEEFPMIPDITSDPILTLPVDDFKDAIAQTVVAASLDESRPVLAGVRLQTAGDELKFAATDSFRLAERTVKLPKAPESDVSMIVPTRTMQELARVLGDVEGDVKIYTSEGQVLFKLDTVEITSRLIEGKLPDYQQIIPTESVATITVDTAEFSRITKVASLFARENAGSVRLEVQAEGRLTVSSNAAELGENSSSADCEVEGDDAEISLNSRFLSEALNVINTPQTEFVISGKLSACIVRPAGKGTDSYFYLIMPLRS